VSLTTTDVIAIWGALVATAVALVEIHRLFRDRIRLTTSYMWVGLEEESDTIVIANLSPTPVLVSHWTLTWNAPWYRWGIKPVDVTPYPDGPRDPSGFKVDGYATYSMYFAQDDKFSWTGKSSKGRNLHLTLNLFGRRKSVKLKVADGT
jgi:hypothetical protein